MSGPGESKWKTMAEMVDITGIPESTIRRWMKWSHHMIETKKIKNRRYFSKESIDIFQTIRGLYDQGKTREEILTTLEETTPQTYDATPTYETHIQPSRHHDQTAMESIIERNTQALNATAHAIQMLGSQQQKIESLENENMELKKEMTIRDQKNEKDKMELLNEINNMMLELIKNMKGK